MTSRQHTVKLLNIVARHTVTQTHRDRHKDRHRHTDKADTQSQRHTVKKLLNMVARPQTHTPVLTDWGCSK